MHLRASTRAVRLLTAALAVALAGCGSTKAKAAAPTSTTAVVAAGGRVTVFAAASLTESFNEEQAALAKATPAVSVTSSFAGSGVLVKQLLAGAPADVIATADTTSMGKLEKAGLVEAPQVFAHNELEILVAPGNPKHVRSLADLSRRDLVLVLEDLTVPAGKYADNVLKNAGVTVHPKSLELDVKSAVRKVTSGEADVTIVYVTDVAAAGAKGFGVTIPDAVNSVATYPIAVLKAAKHHAAAEAFVAAVLSPAGQAVLARHRFMPR